MAETSNHSPQMVVPRSRFPWGNVVVSVIAIGAIVAVVLMTRADLPTINWVFVAALVSISGLILTVIGVHNSGLSKRSDTLQAVLLSQIEGLKADMLNRVEGLKADMLNQGEGLKAEMVNRVDGLKADMLNQGEVLKTDMLNQGNSLKVELVRHGDRLDSLHSDVQNLIHEVHVLGERVAGLEARQGWPVPAQPVSAESRIADAP